MSDKKYLVNPVTGIVEKVWKRTGDPLKPEGDWHTPTPLDLRDFETWNRSESLGPLTKITEVLMSDKKIPPKFIEGKPRFELILPGPLLQLAEIRTKGAKVHGDHSWAEIKEDDIIGALHRHINKMQRGQVIDKDSGQYHAAHVMCQAMFLCSKHMKMKGE